MVCDETGHTSRKCSCLWSDLKEGFYSGGGGGGGHSHGEEEGIVSAISPFLYKCERHDNYEEIFHTHIS